MPYTTTHVLVGIILIELFRDFFIKGNQKAAFKITYNFVYFCRRKFFAYFVRCFIARWGYALLSIFRCKDWIKPYIVFSYFRIYCINYFRCIITIFLDFLDGV